MAANLISVSQCVAYSGLAADELILGVAPSKLHDRLHERYLLDCGGGHEALRNRIVQDIRGCLALGATKRAADLLIVLRRVLTQRTRTAGGASEGRKPTPGGGLRIVSSRRDAEKGAASNGDNVLSLESYRRKLRLASPSVA
jgi:hypothetical protein